MHALRIPLAAALLLAAAPPHAAEDAASARAARQRGWFTNTVLVTHDGEEVRFFDDVLRDRVVLIDFVFTRCTSACPLLTQKMVQARAALGASAEARFVSISVDPAYDGPARLREFALKHGATGPGWTFLTGRKADVDLVLKRLGERVEAPEDHSTVFIAGNARTNHWLRLRPDSPPAVIAAQLKRLLEESPGG